MAITSVTYDAPVDSNVSGAFSDLDPAQVAGLSCVALTGGGAALIGAAVLPAQVATGLLIGGACIGAGEVNRRTGSYLPFLAKKDEDEATDTVTEAVAS